MTGDLQDLIGVRGVAVPKPGDGFTQEFAGVCVSAHNGKLGVRDSDEMVYEIEPGQFILMEPKKSKKPEEPKDGKPRQLGQAVWDTPQFTEVGNAYSALVAALRDTHRHIEALESLRVKEGVVSFVADANKRADLLVNKLMELADREVKP